MASPCLVLRALDRPLRLVPRLPAEHRAGEHVVEDLPAAASSVRRIRCSASTPGRRSYLALGCHPANCARSDVAWAIFVPDGVTRCVEEPCRDVPLRRRQRLDRPFEMVGDDLRGAAEPVSVAARRLDEPCERSTSHSRCITSWRYGASIRDGRPFSPPTAETAGPSSIRPRPRRRARRDQLVLDRDRFPLERVPSLERLDDRRAPGSAIEAIEA